ncbi:MAG TPA: large conductance mechanosensitive channel protein MscL [Ktedonobacteraceae bacterium]|nr:large conductance mechanosensitive channel protein MscL [Ktedonobacteraceae bacterium]
MDTDRAWGTMKEYGGRGLHAGLSSLGDFEKFIMRGNVVDLAVGIVIGAAFNSVVQEFVKDFLTPLIGLFGGFDFSSWKFTYNHSTFLPGAFLNAVISFLLLALVIYFFVVKPVNALRDRLDHLRPKKEEAPTTRQCPFCLSTVPLKASRCAYCTAQLPPVEGTQVQAEPTPQR